MDEKIRIFIPDELIVHDNGENIMVKLPAHSVYGGFVTRIGLACVDYVQGGVQVLAYANWLFKLRLNVKRRKGWKTIYTARIPAPEFAREVERNEDYINYFEEEFRED